MPLSDEAARRFREYVAQAEPSNIDVARDDALFDFVGWALAREPEALREPYAYEGLMTTRRFSPYKLAYVQTVIAVAQPVLRAYERAARPPRRLTEAQPLPSVSRFSSALNRARS